MADIKFIDPESGMPYPSTGSGTQEAGQTILNYHPVVLDFIRDPSEDRLEGEVWVENAQVAHFDTDRPRPVEFFQSSDAANNRIFIQPGDQIEARITHINGSSVSPNSYYLQTKRQGAPQLSTNGEISFGRFTSKTDVLEFSDSSSPYYTSQFDFIFDIDDLINLDLTEFNMGQGTSYTPSNFGYVGTDSEDQDLSMARRTSDVKAWLDF